MRTHHNIFVFQMLVLARQHRDDVMGSDLLFLLGKVEVLIVTLIFLGLDDRFELQTAKLTDNIIRGKAVTCCAWVSAPKFLRSQICHRLTHLILLRM